MTKERKIKLILISAYVFVCHLRVKVDHGSLVSMMHKGGDRGYLSLLVSLS